MLQEPNCDNQETENQQVIFLNICWKRHAFSDQAIFGPYNLYSNPLWDIRPNSWLNSINDDAIPCSNHVVKSKQLPLQKNQKTTIDLKKVLTINYNNGEKGSYCKNNKMIKTILSLKIEKLQI